ncbi:MAG: hypothetical protein IKT00_11640 [Prevotella sp.]|nr:hypothetical protein [Prevotella sp.]
MEIGENVFNQNLKRHMDREKLKEQFMEMAKNAKEPVCPDVLNDERLEDAFKTSECDEEGYSESIPAIYGDYGYGMYPNGVKFLTLRSASLETSLYSKYLDEEALVWDSVKEELFLYVPDPDGPKVAFKGSRWQYAKKLKPEYSMLSLVDIYLEWEN